MDITWLYNQLKTNMGPSGWWPADSKPEIVLGAILVQNTNWRNADAALTALRDETSLDPNSILSLENERLIKLVKPSGFYRNKARAIKSVFSWFNQFEWEYDTMKKYYGTGLRDQLLKLQGVGPETADVLQVYIFDKPVFIADSYTRRLFSALNWMDAKTYQELWNNVSLPKWFTFEDAQEFHGLIDNFGKEYLKRPADFNQSFLSK
ncbi:deoxyribonuclease I [Lentilactobacillus sp. Marseille-Q4993]|uniref:endonuclease III domain-containing protein n=1 Tax=Lentilactobacillus sp. Marseille-Q4993 TaxID=3039492 RepID=UPI0024BC153D|nr:deoxyribonuclease I [Lentilactobacillus sp. Marseille-Q4993]